MSEGSPKLAKSPSMGASSSSPTGSPTGVNLLRKKNKDKGNPFNTASKLMGAMVDSVETLGKKVTTNLSLDNIAQSFAGSPKTKVRDVQMTAPVGVTQAFSLALTHIVAPLWSVGGKPLGVHRPISLKSPEVRDLAAQMDANGVDLEVHFDALRSSPELATAYILLLVRKLLAIELTGDNRAPLFSDIPPLLIREVVYKGEYEEHHNDETVAHDQASRLLTEVGGSWKPRGAADLPHHVHETRCECLINALYASVCLNYLYNDEALQHTVDALSGQLFLLSYSETLVALMAGIKSAGYAAKYFVQLARPAVSSANRLTSDCITPAPFVESVLLQECNAIVSLAVENFVHRNDTGELVIAALTRAVSICPADAHVSLFALAGRVMHRVYAVDLHAVSLLMDAVRPFLVQPLPTGLAAMTLTSILRRALASANSLQRDLASSILVAGKDLRSYRCQPIHVVATPYCARAQIFSRIFLDKIDQQRGVSTQLPAAIPASTDPATRAPFPALLDDAVLFIANQATNVFQALYELAHGQESPASDIDLANLFSVQPAHMCPHFHTFFQLLRDKPLVELSRTAPELVSAVVETYLQMMDTEKPVKGVRRFRLEAPRIPMLPMLPIVTTEADEPNEAVKAIIDKHWRYCDQRVTEKEASWLHPKKDLTLSHFIEGYLRLVVCGGSGLVRRLVTSLLAMRNTYPGAVPDFQFYLLPFGFNNDLANWIARNDPLYMQQVVGPIQCEEMLIGDAPTAESMLAPVKESQHSLHLRRIINNFVVDAQECNDVVIYQAECVSADGSVNYIPFVANLEVGIHINMAIRSEGGPPATAREVVSSASFSAESSTGQQLSRAKSTLQNLKSQGSMQRGGSMTLSSPEMGPNASFAGSSLPSLGSGSFTFTTFDTEQYVSFGGTTETVDRVLVRMHGLRGIPVATRKHLTESGDVRNCATGVDVLDWISTTYAVFEHNVALKSAQTLLEMHLLQCVCVPMGKEPQRFIESGLYTLCPREDIDVIPTCPPCTRSRTVEHAAAIRHGVDESGQFGAQVPCLRMRVVFFPLESDICYSDLTEANCVTRDVVWLKLKSCGSSEDNGATANPTNCVLNMTMNEVEKRRPARARDVVDKFDHYQLRFGERQTVDPRCVLVIENRPPHQSNVAADAASPGLFAAIDGDIFGPFSAIRVRPVTIRPTADRPQRNVATMTLMSFTKCVDSL